MRAGKNHRFKRRLLREAVADNLDTIRGVPPRGVRPIYRMGRLWLRRGSLVLVPLTLAGATFIASNANTSPPPAPAAAVHRAVIQQTALPYVHRATPRPSLEAAPLQPTDPAAFPLSIRRVVVDAGHGGTDPGASSAAQLSEKDITLDIARRLTTLLQQDGFDVVTTRQDDHLVPLRERARLANTSDGDIFVSIHVNAIPQPNTHGVETYYLGATKDPSLTNLAAAENRASGYSMNDLRKLLDGIYADARRDESHRLAAAVQDKLYAGLRGNDSGLQNWGVKRAPFIVLVATDMPAILAEVGCLSNEREAAMLARPEYRQQVAAALFEGIRAYGRMKAEG